MIYQESVGNRWVLTVLSVLLLGLPSWGETDPVRLFHLPFDESVEADHAVGNPSPLAAREIEFGPGIKGSAIRIGPDAVLEYAAPGNLRQERGTVTFWFKPEWATEDQPLAAGTWRALFSNPRPRANRNGSGALWLWFHGGLLRGDTSDPYDSYVTSPVDAQEGVWHHLAMTWGEGASPRMFFDGREVGSKKDSANPLRLPAEDAVRPVAFENFFVGHHKGGEKAEGWFDELEILDAPLSPEQILHRMARVVPLRLDVSRRYLSAGEPSTVEIRMSNLGSDPLPHAPGWRVTVSGRVLAEGILETRLGPGESRSFTVELPPLEPTRIDIEGLLDPNAREPAPGPSRDTLWAVATHNPWLAPPGELNLEEVETIDIVQRAASGEGFVAVGDTVVRTLDEQPYLEAGRALHNRFAVHFRLPEAGTPYLLEWTYPDDAKRSMDVVAQSARASGGEYTLQAGVYTGDEFPNSGRMKTARYVYWARTEETALIFKTARADAPAAASTIRIHRIVDGFPDAAVRSAEPVDGDTRTVALYYEDPALAQSFGVRDSRPFPFLQTLQRLIAYMKWTGQDLLAYPMVWYQGKIRETYNPRNHPPNFMEMILREFEANGLSFMATINLHNVPISSEWVLSRTTIADGSLHPSPVMIHNTGRPNPGRWHGSSPRYNPLHPVVRNELRRQVDWILDQGEASPAFRGIILHLTRHTTPWFGHLEAGYNDYVIEAFEADTGLRLDVDRAAPNRGRLYYEWLMEHAREEWIRWRCEQIAVFYRSLAERIAERRPDLHLRIVVYTPVVSEWNDPRIHDPSRTLEFIREAGLDPELYAGADNIVLAQTIYPADYRWTAGRHSNWHPRSWAVQRDRYDQAGPFALLAGANMPWVNLHDRYWESAIGGSNALQADWLSEIGWRVSTLSPPGRAFLQPYLQALRHHDVFGVSKGGFLIGTHGSDHLVAEFARAFRALPAVPFETVPDVPEPTRVRARQHDGATWFYAINPTPDPVTVRLRAEAPGVEVLDLSRRVTETQDGAWGVELEPWQLRSFRIEGQHVLRAD